MKYFAPSIILILCAVCVGVWRGCENKKHLWQGGNEPLAPLEQKRQRMVYTDSVMYSVWVADTLEAYKRFKARERIKDSTIAILSIQVAKARQSAEKFAKSGKVEDCRDALYDCQGENETKGYAIAIQNRMLSASDSLNRRHVSEMLRQMSVKDSAFTGWQEANTALKKAQKPKPWGLGVHAGYGAGNQGLTPFLGVGISYSPLRW